MKNNSVKPKIKRVLVKFNMGKSIIYKSLFTVIILLVMFLFTKIDKNPTNKILETINTNINYEFQIKEDSKKIYTKAKNMFDSTLESIPVFNTEEKFDPPVTGMVYRSFDTKIDSSNGTVDNGGIEIKLDDDSEPVSIVNGKITNIEKQENKGYFITIEKENIRIIYGYLSGTTLKEGDMVKAGDIIGEVGINKDGDRYLRVELYVDDELVDPEKYIDF